MLEDLWLEKIQQRAQVDRLLESFATRSGLVPDGAYRIRDPQALPDELQLVLTETRSQVWVCFSHGAQSWPFTGLVSISLSHQRKAPVLQVNSYSEEGTLIDIGTWSAEHDGRWRPYGD